MAVFFLSLGSNLQPEQNIRGCLDALSHCFGAMQVSSAYHAQAVGFQGASFINLVVRLESEWSVGDMQRWLKALEDQYGRDRLAPKYADRTLDVDILLVDDWVGTFEQVRLPRDEVLHHAFVLWPLAELAPLTPHPVVRTNFEQLWQQWRGEQVIAPMPFVWRGCELPILG